MTSPATAFEAPELTPLIGREVRLTETSRAIAGVVRRLAPARLASLHVTCSDERERECAEAFQSLVVRELSEGERTRRAPMRTANLGARYEWGCGPVALSHYQRAGDADVLCVAKINGHVGAVLEAGKEPVYGMVEREVCSTTDCGALCAVMAGAQAAFADELRLILSSGGLDRVAMLLDPTVCAPDHRALVAAVVSARLQARKAMLDLLATPGAPDRLLVPSCVTINRPGRDHEVLVGWYAAVRRGDDLELTWTGLEDDPRRVAVEHGPRGVRLVAKDQEGAELDEPRPRTARGPAEHRRLPGELWRAGQGDVEAAEAVVEAVGSAVASLEDKLHDPDHPVRALALKGALVAAAETMAAPALLTLFATGALDLHHAWRLQRIATGAADAAEARVLLESVIAGAEAMDPTTAERALRALQAELT